MSVVGGVGDAWEENYWVARERSPVRSGKAMLDVKKDTTHPSVTPPPVIALMLMKGGDVTALDARLLTG
jgi:hypothetical protein